ncbi:PucR family transcriptional regulator [Saccharopolyspora sp. 5N102]|uniref:PucR family transcriptional regulator n=1 Tax=Saccharopolyspora sp. 5N102 TaxID=3375155 RepID=UPI003794273A
MTAGTNSARRLDHLVARLGASLVSVAAAPGRGFAEVQSVIIHDPHDADDWPAGALLCAVGTRDSVKLADLVRRAAEREAAGVVVKAPAGVDQAVRDAVSAGGVALVELAREASWAHLSDSVRALLAADRLTPGDTQLGGLAAGDLFAVADAVSALLDAAVTLEDRSSQVLAWSARQDDADEIRIAGIVGRQAPRSLTQSLAARGVFRRLDASREPIYVEPVSPGTLPRMAMAVRAGAEVLGYLWAAVHEPFSAKRCQEFLEISKIVAIHLLQYRTRLDSQGTLRAELASNVLHGGDQAADAAARLGIATSKLSVLAVQVVRGDLDADDVASRRVADSFAVHLAAVHPRAVSTVIGEVVYVLLPWPMAMAVAEARSRSVQLAREFADRTAERSGAVIAVGGVADDLNQVVPARAEAEQVLRVQRAQPEVPSVATFAEVQSMSLLLRLSDLLRVDGQRLVGPVEVLLRHDAAQRTRFAESLRAYLDEFGDTNAAASRMHVHANTFRYRLRRICEISGLDLADPDARFQAELHLRLVDLAERREQA